MDELIRALQILRKYKHTSFPTHCEHDIMLISPKIDPDTVSEEDRAELDELGFHISTEYGEKMFASYKFGSC